MGAVIIPLRILAGGGGGFFETFILRDSKKRPTLEAKSDFDDFGVAPSVKSRRGPTTVLLCAVLKQKL